MSPSPSAARLGSRSSECCGPPGMGKEKTVQNMDVLCHLSSAIFPSLRFITSLWKEGATAYLLLCKVTLV